MALRLIRKPVLGLIEQALLALYRSNCGDLERLLEGYGFEVEWGWEADIEFAYIDRIRFAVHDWSEGDVVQALLDALSEAIMVQQTRPGYAEADENRVSRLFDILQGEGFAWRGSRFDWSGSKSFASSVNGLLRLQLQEFAQESPTLEVSRACAADGGNKALANGGGGVQKAQEKIFIGHGRSTDWMVLKNLIQERLGLKCEEFDRESVAGLSTKERLIEMLDGSCFAFLVMTAEDEHPDGTRHARENVIHEIGLFQGRLGFEKAIILHEEGCEAFSNIRGLQVIRYPKGDIGAKSEAIRKVLEREGIISRG